MKRTTLILLTTIYLLSCTGMAVNRFYCCGKLASITLIYGSYDQAGKGSAKKDNCCKNEKQSFKIKDTHVNVASFALSSPTPVILPDVTDWNVITFIKEHPVNIGYKSNAPPGSLDTPIYTLNCTYRI